jgi:hypothetical protein
MLNEQIQYGSTGEFQIEVYNTHGEQQNISFQNNTPDLSCLPVGAYVIRFHLGDDVFTHGIVKE